MPEYYEPLHPRPPARGWRWPALCVAFGGAVAALGASVTSALPLHHHVTLPRATAWATHHTPPSHRWRSPVFAAPGGANFPPAPSSSTKGVEGDDDDEDEPEKPDPAEIEAALKALDDIKRAKDEERAAAAQKPSEDYVPKVSTWGVFERPKDISKAYGGGRTIKAGRSVPREEAEKRRAELQALIAKMRQGDGVTPAMMVAAQNNMTQADRFLEKMNYQQAEELYRSVRRALPYRNRLAGRATLDLGTVLDAQGRYREAAELYKSLTKHPDLSVRKQAIRLSDSFDALRFFHYSNSSTDRTWTNSIQPLLRRFVTGSSVAVAEYHATPEDLALAKRTEQLAYLIMAALFLVPLGAVAILSSAQY